MEDPHYFLRDTNASDGDPSGGKATAWVDWPLAGQRAHASLRALAQLSPWAIPREVAMELTGHSGKHDLVCVSRAGGDPSQDSNDPTPGSSAPRNCHPPSPLIHSRPATIAGGATK